MHIMTERGWRPLCPKALHNAPEPEGIFRPVTTTLAGMQTQSRADRWEFYMNLYINGEYGGDRGWEDMWRDMNLSEAIYGAFGERL